MYEIWQKVALKQLKIKKGYQMPRSRNLRNLDIRCKYSFNAYRAVTDSIFPRLIRANKANDTWEILRKED